MRRLVTAVTDGGRQPWLGPRIRESCDESNRMLVRTASNAYFPQTMSVISLPDRDEAVARAVDQVWEHYLQYIEDIDDMTKERKRKPPVAAALEGFSDEDVFAEVQSRKQGTDPGPDQSVKEAEFETLVSVKEEIGLDRPDGDFFARYLPKVHWDQPWMDAIERVVLVHRLREVTAQIGFSRFESYSPNAEELCLRAGEILPAEPGTIPTRHPSDSFWMSPIAEPFRIIDGPDFRQDSRCGDSFWAECRFRVGSRSNRMGLRLEGDPVKTAVEAERLSTPVAAGAVQLAGGQPIILGVACGTMGGYPHIAHVISADLHRVGQLKPGDLLAVKPADRAKWLKEQTDQSLTGQALNSLKEAKTPEDAVAAIEKNFWGQSFTRCSRHDRFSGPGE